MKNPSEMPRETPSPTSRIRTRRGRTRFCGGPLNQRVHTLLLFESASSRLTGSKRLQDSAQGLTVNPRRPVRVPGAFLANRRINHGLHGLHGWEKAFSLSVKSVKSVVSPRSEGLLNAWMNGAELGSSL